MLFFIYYFVILLMNWAILVLLELNTGRDILRVVAALVMLMVTGYWLVPCGVMLLPYSVWTLQHWSVDLRPALSVGCNDFSPLLATQTVRSAINSRQRAEETTEHALWLGHGRTHCHSPDEASSASFFSHFQVEMHLISAWSGALTGVSFIILRRKPNADAQRQYKTRPLLFGNWTQNVLRMKFLVSVFH